jgi:hypothetical protein
MTVKSITIIFDEAPQRWGLRGDPFLWREMALRFQSEVVPDNAGHLLRLLHKYFWQLTGEQAFEGKDILVKRYRDHGVGMSAGLVCSTFWVYTAFPLLLKRFQHHFGRK